MIFTQTSVKTIHFLPLPSFLPPLSKSMWLDVISVLIVLIIVGLFIFGLVKAKIPVQRANVIANPGFMMDCSGGIACQAQLECDALTQTCRVPVHGSCTLGTDCTSGVCSSGFCQDSSGPINPDDIELYEAAENNGFCELGNLAWNSFTSSCRKNVGDSCQSSVECDSFNCVSGSCALGPAQNGYPCTNDSDCQTGHCSDKICQNIAQNTNTPGASCVTGQPTGAVTWDVECNCQNGLCFDGSGFGLTCPCDNAYQCVAGVCQYNPSSFLVPGNTSNDWSPYCPVGYTFTGTTCTGISGQATSNCTYTNSSDPMTWTLNVPIDSLVGWNSTVVSLIYGQDLGNPAISVQINTAGGGTTSHAATRSSYFSRGKIVNVSVVEYIGFKWQIVVDGSYYSVYVDSLDEIYDYQVICSDDIYFCLLAKKGSPVYIFTKLSEVNVGDFQDLSSQFQASDDYIKVVQGYGDYFGILTWAGQELIIFDFDMNIQSKFSPSPDDNVADYDSYSFYNVPVYVNAGQLMVGSTGTGVTNVYPRTAVYGNHVVAQYNDGYLFYYNIGTGLTLTLPYSGYLSDISLDSGNLSLIGTTICQ